MLIRLDTLQPWTGEPVVYKTDVADLHRRDGTIETVTVTPYTFEVRHPLNIEQLWTADELRALGLVKPVPFVLPEGKRFKEGALPRYVKEPDGSVSEHYETEDIPPPPVLSPEEKLSLAGLTKEDLRALLNEEA